jgi:hypothetical protein
MAVYVRGTANLPTNAGLDELIGPYDASTNLFPATGGSGPAGAIAKGDEFFASVAGVCGGTNVNINDRILALVDAPGQTAGNWNINAASGAAPVANNTLVGNISGGTAAPIGLTGTQARALVKLEREAYVDTAPAVAPVVTGARSYVLGSGHVVDSPDVIVLGGANNVDAYASASNLFLAANLSATFHKVANSTVVGNAACVIGSTNGNGLSQATILSNANFSMSFAFSQAVAKITAIGNGTVTKSGYASNCTYIGNVGAVTDSTTSSGGAVVIGNAAATTISGSGIGARIIIGTAYAQSSSYSCFVAGFGANTINDAHATAIMSYNCQVSSQATAIGSNNSYATGGQSGTLGCDNATASGAFSWVLGSYRGGYAGLYTLGLPGKSGIGTGASYESCATIRNACIPDDVNEKKHVRSGEILSGAVTTNATPKRLHVPSATAEDQTVFYAQSGATYSLLGVTTEICGIDLSGTTILRRRISGTFKGTNAGALTQVGSTVVELDVTEAGSATWATAFEVLTGYAWVAGIATKVTGEAGKTITWSAVTTFQQLATTA